MTRLQSCRECKSEQERQGTEDRQANIFMNKINQLRITAKQAVTVGDVIQPLGEELRPMVREDKPLGGGGLRHPPGEGASASQTSGREAEKHPERGNIKHRIPEARIISAYSREKKRQNEQKKKQVGPGLIGPGETGQQPGDWCRPLHREKSPRMDVIVKGPPGEELGSC